ncbi:AcrB/AcrD/AcrF family protein [Sphingomicrobium sp. XHP0235]|uniref:AcrB/AcrD/AcrF family protein n=1 Tax=Sphingomicrobium aquimarinum TaxID=3133971 RepID=UPI0031FEEA52
MRTATRGGDAETMVERLNAMLERRWIAVLFFVWLLFANIAIFSGMQGIVEFQLRDTDDNLRMAQVRDWLGGQGWFDLRQYRMLSPEGADIHWSRIVDLPIAGLILLFEPFVGMATAERFAGVIAPLLAMFVALIGMGLVVRRVVGPKMAPLMAIAFIFSASLAFNFWPLRLDHHNWQLAALSFVLAGAVDPERRRGGLVTGFASATSLAIGLEMLIPLALVGAGLVLGWVWRAEEARRLGAYGASLALGCGVGFLLFASEANRAMLCDALTPVWTVDMLLAGALAVLLAWRTPQGAAARFAWAAGAGILLAAVHALAFPQCLSRLEGVDPRVAEMWLSRVTEAQGLMEHGPGFRVKSLGPVLTGLVGYVLWWRANGAEGETRRQVLLLGIPALVMGALLFWQVRAGAAAQLLALPGSMMLLALLFPKARASGSLLVRVLGAVGVALVALNVLWLPLATKMPKNATERAKAELRAELGNEPRLECRDDYVLSQLDALPATTIFSHIDLAPRLLVTTHHRTIVGPYHRNDAAIGYVLSVLQAPPQEDAAAARTVRALGATKVMICAEPRPEGQAEGDDLEARLYRGEVPDWLERDDAPWLKGLPIRLYSVR